MEFNWQEKAILQTALQFYIKTLEKGITEDNDIAESLNKIKLLLEKISE